MIYRKSYVYWNFEAIRIFLRLNFLFSYGGYSASIYKYSDFEVVMPYIRSYAIWLLKNKSIFLKWNQLIDKKIIRLMCVCIFMNYPNVFVSFILVKIMKRMKTGEGQNKMRLTNNEEEEGGGGEEGGKRNGE